VDPFWACADYPAQTDAVKALAIRRAHFVSSANREYPLFTAGELGDEVSLKKQNLLRPGRDSELLRALPMNSAIPVLLPLLLWRRGAGERRPFCFFSPSRFMGRELPELRSRFAPISGTMAGSSPSPPLEERLGRGGLYGIW
jgi:hypothetical protein